MVSICGTVKTHGLFNALTFHITALKGVRLVDTHLVGGWATPLKNRKVSWDDYSQYMENCDLMGKTMGNGKTIGKWWFNGDINGISWDSIFLCSKPPTSHNEFYFLFDLSHSSLLRCTGMLSSVWRAVGDVSGGMLGWRVGARTFYKFACLQESLETKIIFSSFTLKQVNTTSHNTYLDELMILIKTQLNAKFKTYNCTVDWIIWEPSQPR